jgi:GNAT superfamily N-acetyltransferase
VTLNITKDDWFKTIDGWIPRPTSPSNAKHCVMLVGYDDDKKDFLFRNSWGVRWGDTFEATWEEGWLVDGHRLSANLPSIGARVEVHGWVVSDLFGGDGLYVFEVVGPSDNRLAWAFALERDGFIDVEELFVRPEHRKQGWGRMLITSLRDSVANRLGKPLRLWVPFSDTVPNNLICIQHLVDPLGLTLKPSGVRWAAYEATARRGPHAAILEPPRAVVGPGVWWPA